jgi:hypothetical protein
MGWEDVWEHKQRTLHRGVPLLRQYQSKVCLCSSRSSNTNKEFQLYKYRHQEIDVHGSKRLFSRGGHTFFRQFTGDTE